MHDHGHASPQTSGTAAGPQCQATACAVGTLPKAIQTPALGTWIHRQYRLQPVPEKSSQGGSQGAGASTTTVPNPYDEQKDAGQQPAYRKSEAGEDDAQAAAWRWRFARKWHAEQQRVIDPENASCSDKVEDALQFLQAGGGAGWNLQSRGLARTVSTDLSGSVVHSIGTFGNGSLLGQELLLDGSYTYSLTAGSLARVSGSEVLQATREMNSMNRRAANLLQQQVELERQAAERWSNVATADNWIANRLDVVEIDDWGTFKFLVLRVRGMNDKQRILIRGRNGCTEANVIEATNRKVRVIVVCMAVVCMPK